LSKYCFFENKRYIQTMKKIFLSLFLFLFILIEPSLSAYKECKKNRPNSKCYNFACVSSDYKNEYVIGDFNGSLMSSIDGKRNNSKNLTKVKASTLENILNSVLSDSTISIDFLSLDTKGYELEILNGLNLKKYSPKYILIEIYKDQYIKIENFLLSNGYVLHSNFTNYNNKDNPHWDGTHNDYLFVFTGNINNLQKIEKIKKLVDSFFHKSNKLTSNETVAYYPDGTIVSGGKQKSNTFYRHICYYTIKEALTHLIKLNKSEYTIVETGCSAHGTKSTLLWDKFVNIFGGKVISVDLNQKAVNETNAVTSCRTTVICSDSLKFLPTLTEKIDFLYLDSYDVDFLNPKPSAEHHLKEFYCVEKLLSDNCIILIDDTPLSPEWLDGGKRNYLYNKLKHKFNPDMSGKGSLVNHYLSQVLCEKIDHKYQVLWKFKGVPKSIWRCNYSWTKWQISYWQAQTRQAQTRQAINIDEQPINFHQQAINVDEPINVILNYNNSIEKPHISVNNKNEFVNNKNELNK